MSRTVDCRTAIVRPRRLLVLCLLVLAVELIVEVAEARPGGGHTYRGSGRSRSGGGHFGGHAGGGGSSGDLFVLLYYLIRLLVEVPLIGVPVLVVGVAFVAFRAREGFRVAAWDTLPGREPERRTPGDTARRRLEALRQSDPAFSFVLFEDFLYALFAEVHTHRGGGRLALMAPFVSEEARHSLLAHPVDAVRGILVGGMRITDVSFLRSGAPSVSVGIDFEANYGEVAPGQQERTYYVHEHWTLRRSVSAPSRPPEKTRIFQCPSCGAALDQVRGRTCGYCSKVVDTGEFDWVVTEIALLERDPRPPALAGDAPESGTDEPTAINPEAPARWKALTTRDPALGWDAFVLRIELLFRELGAAWTEQDPKRARPFLTDGVLQAWAYWFDAYRAQGLRNRTEGARIEAVELARVVSDKYYDAVTVRLFASSRDYTMDASGKVVGGSQSRTRRYGEYWTLIRGSTKVGPPKKDPECPNCGAPLAVEMTGSCTYCQAKVTRGEFDWVLSRIEQDETYEG